MLENPAIHKAEIDGGCTNSITTDTCDYCSQPIYKGEKRYYLGCLTCCNEWDCKFEAFTANANEMAVKMADDWDMTHEAVCWYFENYAKEGEGE